MPNNFYGILYSRTIKGKNGGVVDGSLASYRYVKGFYR